MKGTGNSSAVLVQAGVTATLQGLMITNGTGLPGSAGVSGGGIFNDGQLTVTRCLIEDHEAEFGGAIFNETGARLTIDDTVIQDNKAVTATGNPVAGAIYNRFGAQVTVTNNRRIAENEANNAGAIYNNGVFVINGGTLLTTNTADFDGGAIINDEGNLTIDASSVVGNKAKGKGGGILNFDGQVTIRNSAEVGDNEADLGGGIYVQQPAMLTVIDSAVTGNDADALGSGIFNAGGTVNLQSSTVFENDARVTGGGLFNTEGGVVTLDAQSAVVDNDPNNCIGTNACGA